MTRTHTACRSCGNSELKLILSFGNMPLANSLLTDEQLSGPEPTYPLDLVFCPNCALVQITETVPPETLFGNYLYLSSYSQTVLQNSKELAQSLMESRGLSANSLVVELGSNDGYQLQFFASEKIPVLGIDPAKNIAEVANAKGIRTLCGFFGEKMAVDLSKQNLFADVIIAKNVLAHVADLNGFIEGIRLLLKKNGVVIIEVPYLKDLIERREFDTIYHEHLCYFSLTALESLFRKHKMSIVDLEHLPIHGGSLRLCVSHQPGTASGSVEAMLRQEREMGLNQLSSYLDFALRVQEIRDALFSLLVSKKREGHRIAAYGAAAKGTILLNYCKIGPDLIDFVVDVSPYKQGLNVPGVHLKIYPPSKLLEEVPKFTLLLAWNIAEEIMKTQSEYQTSGGRFIIPIPEPKVLGEESIGHS